VIFGNSIGRRNGTISVRNVKRLMASSNIGQIRKVIRCEPGCGPCLLVEGGNSLSAHPHDSRNNVQLLQNQVQLVNVMLHFITQNELSLERLDYKEM